MLEFYGDYHVHSRMSDGRQTVEQIARAAAEKGLKEVAITDHGPLAARIGVKHAATYQKLREEIEKVQIRVPDVTIYLGAEANIRDLEGNLDLSSDLIQSLDILIAGLHPYTVPTSISAGIGLFINNHLRHISAEQRKRAVKANTAAVVAVLNNNPAVDILAHPGLFFHVDTYEVAKACVANEVLFEINCGHEHPPVSDIIEAKRSGVNFIINSDSHFPETIGELSYGYRIVEEAEIPESRIVNLAFRGGYKKWGKNNKTCVC